MRKVATSSPPGSVPVSRESVTDVLEILRMDRKISIQSAVTRQVRTCGRVAKDTRWRIDSQPKAVEIKKSGTAKSQTLGKGAKRNTDVSEMLLTGAGRSSNGN